MNNPSLEEHTQALADYLPNGRVFEAKNIKGSNLRDLLTGLAGELQRVQDYLCVIEKEYLPDQTVLYLDEWEKALGIPDNCFGDSTTESDRRRDILAKLTALGVQTAQDFEELALLFGKVVTVTPLSEEAFPPYNVPFTPVSLPESRFTIVVTGVNLVTNLPPYDVPFTPGNDASIIECLFNQLKPANCTVIFRNA